MSGPVHVLSIQTTLLGNRTYGNLLRRLFAESTRVRFDAHWNAEHRELRVPGLRSLFWRRVPGRFVQARNLDFFPTRYEVGTSLLARMVLRRELRRARPDVVHFHTQCLALLSNALMQRIPTVVTVDMTAMQTAEQQAPRSSRWTYAPSFALERATFRRAAAIVTFSEWAARSVTGEHGVDAARVHVVPPGVNLGAFDDVLALRRTLPPVRTRTILFIGGEFERKGGPALVRAFRRYVPDPDVELHLVSASAPTSDDPRIVVHRHVEAYSTEWRTLYARADVFAMPTRGDASPHVFAEAMAAGIPAIGTRVGSIAETIVDGECGYVVDRDDDAALGDRLRRLLDDEPRRRAFGEAGRRRAERLYDATVNAARLEAIFVAAARRA